MPALFQNSFYVVNNLNAILYGSELVLYFMTLRQWQINRKRTSWDTSLVWLSTVQVVLITIYWTTQTYFGQQMWIVYADYPGGMDAYLVANAAVWYQTWGSTAIMLCNLLADMLLIHRLYIIWNSKRIVILPVILWFAALGVSIGLLYESGRPNGDYFVGIANIFGTCWNTITFALNFTVTVLICGRIIYVGRRVGLPDTHHARVYTGAVAIVVESALPFTVFSLAYVITFAMQSDVAIAFSFYSMFTCISPQLITLRVLTRRAWTKDSGAQFMTSIQFNDDRTEDTAETRISTDMVHVELGMVDKRSPSLPSSSISQFTDIPGLTAQ
ncbi:hypothetical protein C8Q80DRAFT_1258673 [Daedaleopsis nitida]|nr:hypothetical protein C8Q80DRAFT_1258673 [Daedaleopsis nitida]